MSYLALIIGIVAAMAPVTRTDTEALVRRDLAERLKVDVEQVRVVSASDRTWPDSNLGCGRKGLVEPTPIPGYAVTLEHAGKRYEYHTDRNGTIKRCDPVKVKAEKRRR
jgi:hypothetical protein